MSRLLTYLNEHGILSCNENKDLPCLSDFNFTWSDMTDLIDSHQLFYCKAFKKRTVYLSVECYYLLKRCRSRRFLNEPANRLLLFIENSSQTDTALLKELSGLPQAEYKKAFQFLLENLEITAIQNETVLNPNWSVFLYTSADKWDEAALQTAKASPPLLDRLNEIEQLSENEAREQLRNLVGESMKENDFIKFTK